ncbi:MAG: response regulator [Victivallales bacterium]|nr:response regulator [Victivallales bacterium]MCF7888746.1 response regulator [Victivallales bacterium]
MENYKPAVLVVDDEEDIVDFLKYNLEKQGYAIFSACSGEECLKIIERKTPDLILLDIMMSGISGIEVCQKLKKNQKTKDIPVIMLTAKTTENDIVSGLDSGADDYIVKPFSMNILNARIKVLLRRNKPRKSNILTVDKLCLNTETREVKIDGENIDLTFSRFEILKLFIRNKGKVFSRKNIVKEIKGENYPVTERAVDVHIVEMRKILGEYGKYIKTVRGAGYKFSYTQNEKQ